MRASGDIQHSSGFFRGSNNWCDHDPEGVDFTASVARVVECEGRIKGLFAFGAVALGAVIAYRYQTRESGSRLGDVVRRRVMNRMERMMASLPEGAPPKLVMTVLPRLQDQNEQIIAMLREQNELLRKQLHAV